MAELRFRLLGPLEVAAGRRSLSLGGAKQRALLAVLLLHPNELVSRDRLIDDLWGSQAPPGAAHNLEVYVSRLRKTLRTDHESQDSLLTRPGGYMLRVEPGQLDVDEFERLLGRAYERLAQGDADAAVVVLDQALALWHGEPLADLAFEPFAQTAIGRLHELRLTALETRFEAELALGRHARLVSELEALAAREPLREALCGQLMLALYRCGRQADALAQYQRTRNALVEVGLEPGQPLQRLEQAILRHEAELDLPKSAATPTPAFEQREPAAVSSVRRRSGRLSRRRLGLALVGVLVAVAAAATSMLVLAGNDARATGIAADSVGFIDARGSVRSQVSVREAPASAAYGYGALWVSNSRSRTVSRVDPSTRTVRDTIPVGDGPGGIAVGGGGVWVANHDDGTVSWLNPQESQEVKRITVGAGPTAVAFGNGSVWVTNADDRTVSRIDPQTGRVIRVIDTNALGRGIAVGGGFVWVTDESTRNVVQIDPTTNTIAARIPVGEGPTGIEYAAGSIWVANALDGTVSQIDTTTLATKATIPVGGGPSAVAFGEGSVWVSAEFGRRVVRIDPRRGVAQASIAIGNRPQGLAAAPGGIWVAVQESSTGHRGGRLLVLGLALDSIDPAIQYTTTAMVLLGAVYDGLTINRRVGGSAGSQLVPDLARTSPRPSEDGKSYTFHLRRGIRYSDGTPLRAADFRRALERTVANRGPWTPYFTKVVGVARCLRQTRRTPCDLSRGVIVNGPSTLTFRLTAPDARLLVSLAALAPVPAGTPLEDVGSRPIPSTGPYAIQSYVPGRLLILSRNRHFHVWSPAARPDGYPDEIVYRIVNLDDANRAVREVLAGKADLSTIVPTTRIEALHARYPRLLHLTPARATWLLFLNVRRPPFDDLRVRRALNYAVDRKKIAALWGGLPVVRPTCQLVPPNVPGYAPYCPYTIAPNRRGEWIAPDLAKARSLIAASGTRGQRIGVFSFTRNQGQYVVRLLRRLGYRARLHNYPNFYEAGRQEIRADAQAGIFGWYGGTLAWDMLSTVGCRFGRWNLAHFCDPHIDAQVERLATLQPADPAAAAKLAATIDREIVEQAPWVPLVTPPVTDFTSTRVGNYQAAPGGFSLPDQMWVR